MPPITPDLTTEAFLHAHGIRVAAEKLDPMVQEAIGRLQRALFRTDPRTELTAEETSALERGGFPLDPRDLGLRDPLAATAAEYAALLKTSLALSAAAEKLGVSPRWVVRLLTSSPPKLYGIRVESGWVLPAFQFEASGLVPGISEVIARLDPELHPVAIFRWLTTPNPDLQAENGEEAAMSPLEWLRLGFPTEPVVRLAADL